MREVFEMRIVVTSFSTWSSRSCKLSSRFCSNHTARIPARNSPRVGPSAPFLLRRVSTLLPCHGASRTRLSIAVQTLCLGFPTCHACLCDFSLLPLILFVPVRVPLFAPFIDRLLVQLSEMSNMTKNPAQTTLRSDGQAAGPSTRVCYRRRSGIGLRLSGVRMCDVGGYLVRMMVRRRRLKM